jgi:hypothetical protein
LAIVAPAGAGGGGGRAVGVNDTDSGNEGVPAAGSGRSSPAASDSEADSTPRAYERAQPLSTTGITDAGVIMLARACRGLRTLRTQGQPSLTDAGLARALRRLPYLESLDVRGCRGVGDVAVGAAARFCPRLRELRLFGCVSVSDASIGALPALRHLALLDLYGCRGLSTPAVTDVVRKLAERRGVGGPATAEASANADGAHRASEAATASNGSGAGCSATPPSLTVFVGGIPSIRAALAPVMDTSPLAMARAATATLSASVPEPLVQLSALFPRGVDVRVC